MRDLTGGSDPQEGARRETVRPSAPVGLGGPCPGAAQWFRSRLHGRGPVLHGDCARVRKDDRFMSHIRRKILFLGIVAAVAGCMDFGMLFAQESEGCEVTVTAQNRKRTITGVVATECEWPHSPPWGNWGVISDYGKKKDGFQFPGWKSKEGWLQWNSCTHLYRDPEHFNPRGSGRQDSSHVASHGGYRRRYENDPCPDEHGVEHTDEGCSNGAWERRSTNYMKLYELDLNDGMSS